MHVSPFRSAPAQKARPVPVMIPTLSVGSASSHDQILSSSAWPSWLMQFKSLGRFSRTSKTPGAGYVRTQYLPDGSGSSKFGLDIFGLSRVSGPLIKARRINGNSLLRHDLRERCLMFVCCGEEHPSLQAEVRGTANSTESTSLHVSLIRHQEHSTHSYPSTKGKAMAS